MFETEFSHSDSSGVGGARRSGGPVSIGEILPAVLRRYQLDDEPSAACLPSAALESWSDVALQTEVFA